MATRTAQKTKLYSFDDHPEHRAQLKPWADKWIANALSTSAMTDAERSTCRAAVNGLYAAAGLAAPRHIVFVPSPFVLRFAGGFAAAIWYLHHQATFEATRQATFEATSQATDQATFEATDQATRQATFEATRQATFEATFEATDQATSALISCAAAASPRARSRPSPAGAGA